MHKADLHLHSKFSDGLLTPGEVISMINDKNIKIASLTDHDNIAGTKIAEEELNLVPTWMEEKYIY